MHRSKVDPKKEEQDRLQGILLDMLKEEENKYCADCNAKTPRWASYNLGVFICIRCAGIHRNLGVHISKVRSVNLDSWNPEQVQSMRVMGNEKARKVYEHSLPEHFRRSMSDHQMEQFIRAKYDQKRYMLKDFVYPRVDISELPKPGQTANKKTPVAIMRNPPAASAPRVSVPAPSAVSSSKKEPAVSDLLDFSAPTTAADNANGNLDLFSNDLASLNIASQSPAESSVTPEVDDIFGSFVSATPSQLVQSAVPTGQSADNSKTSDDLMGLSSAINGHVAPGTDEKKSTADILSLFGGSSVGAPPPQLVAPGGFAAFGMQAANPPPQSMGVPLAGSTAAHPNLNAPNNTMNAPHNAMGMPPSLMCGTGPASSAFPNPFDSPMDASMFTSSATPHTATNVNPTFSVPNKTNAFADLSLGKVMSSMNGIGMRPSPTPQQTVSAASTNTNNMNFDDLLGL